MGRNPHQHFPSALDLPCREGCADVAPWAVSSSASVPAPETGSRTPPTQVLPPPEARCPSALLLAQHKDEDRCVLQTCMRDIVSCREHNPNHAPCEEVQTFQETALGCLASPLSLAASAPRAPSHPRAVVVELVIVRLCHLRGHHNADQAPAWGGGDLVQERSSFMSSCST